MKKIIAIAIFIYVITATLTGYAQFFNNQDTGSNTTEQSNKTTDNSETFGGFFRSDAPSPGDRPGNGEGIGQDMIIQDGLHLLIACGVMFSLFKFYKQKKMHFIQRFDMF